jgi:hypothetical protein
VIFPNNESLLDHLRQGSPCRVAEVVHIEGFDERQEQQLRNRRNFHGMPDYDKWMLIYTLLFPAVAADRVPNPCKSCCGNTLKITLIITDYEPIPDRLKDISKFLNEKLPSLVTKALEGRFKTIESDTSRETVLEIVRQAQRGVLEEIQKSSIPRSPEYQQQSFHAEEIFDDIDIFDIWADKNHLRTVWDLHDDVWSRVFSPSSEASEAVEVDTPMKHELLTSKKKRKASSHGDLENESIRGLDTPLAHQRDHKKARQTEHSDSCTTSDVDGNDANTSDSDSSTALTQAAADKYVVDICNYISQRLEKSFDVRLLTSVSKNFPALIEAFAVKLGSEMPNQSNFGAMSFVHRHHQ